MRKNTLVCIFDWGRSELNSMKKHMQLSEKDQLDRGEFWRYYMGAMAAMASKDRHFLSFSSLLEAL